MSDVIWTFSKKCAPIWMYSHTQHIYPCRWLTFSALLQGTFMALLQGTVRALLQCTFSALLQGSFSCLIQDTFSALLHGTFSALIHCLFYVRVDISICPELLFQCFITLTFYRSHYARPSNRLWWWILLLSIVFVAATWISYMIHPIIPSLFNI